jgi:putative FmdB family regulatory protein
MPIYDYECNQCQFRFEKRQQFDEAPLATCPQCQGRLRRVIHSTPLIFKGRGFYITDSRQSRPSGETKEESDKKHKPGDQK